MPIYQYRCKECEHEFEIRQRMADEPLTHCPVCQGEIRRIVNSVGVVFKGKGFYVTDNRSGSSALMSAKSDKDKAEKTEAPDSSAGSEKSASTESKESKPDKSPAPVASPANTN